MNVKLGLTSVLNTPCVSTWLVTTIVPVPQGSSSWTEVASMLTNVSEAITCVTVLLNIVTIFQALTRVTVTMAISEIIMVDASILMNVASITSIITVSMDAALTEILDIVVNVKMETSEMKSSTQLWVTYKSFALVTAIKLSIEANMILSHQLS